jgi:hypothetical protein
LRINSGQTATLQAGIDIGRGDVTIIMESNVQHIPEDIHSSSPTSMRGGT